MAVLELSSLRQWLRANPPNAHNQSLRLAHLQLLQEAADALSAEEYRAYSECWADSPRCADRFEHTGVLGYLRETIRETIADIFRNQVQRGVFLWHLYNVGYVIKTPDFCCGIDVQCRDAAELAPALDLLLVSHGDLDHCNYELIEKMLSLHKPVITLNHPGTIHPKPGCAYHFGDCKVLAYHGDHDAKDPTRRNDTLIHVIEFSDQQKIIVHASDNSNLAKLPAIRPDVFIFHVANNLPVRKAVELLKPRLALPSHILELSHSQHAPAAWRHSFSRAFALARSLRPARALVLSWGERIPLPGASIARDSSNRSPKKRLEIPASDAAFPAAPWRRPPDRYRSRARQKRRE